MCQCVLFDFWWWNLCGVMCAGVHQAICCISCWLMKPQEMTNKQCCSIGKLTGYGGNCFCYGCLLCTPDFVKQYCNLKNSNTAINNNAYPSGRDIAKS